jgi:hypothetical protein
MASTPGYRLSRRTLLAGMAGLGGSALLAACSSSSVSAGGGTTSTAVPALNIVPRFDQNQYAAANSDVRLVLSVLDSKGDTPPNLPASLDFTATTGGAAVGGPIHTAIAGDGIPIPYYPVRFKTGAPGTYTLATTINGVASSTTFAVNTAEQLGQVQPGMKLRAADTPTTTDARGVNPICTRVSNGKPDPCPLHALNLRDALTTGKPTAFLVSTPAYCQIGICGPVLNLLLEQQAANPGTQFIHAEVYKNPASGSQDTAPIVDAYSLDYEPALFLANAAGVVVERLDNVFDRTEIKAGLAKIA